MDVKVGLFEMKKFDASVRRWRYWVRKARSGMRCPRCGGELESEYHTYVLLVKQAGEIESNICGTEGGYFCLSCPSIVLDREKFDDIAKISTQRRDFGYMVPALVDMEAVPPEKSNIEFGSDDNPIPLVEFKEPKLRSIQGTQAPKRKRAKKKKRK